MRHFHILASLTALAAMLPLTGCNDTPAEADRLIPVGADRVNRTVLVEEFTGQMCVNCPTAHDELDRITEMFGSDHVIVVAIHGNSTQMAIPAPAGLGTALGADYCRANGISAWPSAVVNRRSGDLGMNYGKWLSAVVDALAAPEAATLTASLTLEPDGTTLTATATVNPVAGALPADTRLQLWLTEDHVTAPQFMPDNKPVDRNYVHQHVLRAAFNGPDGQWLGAIGSPSTVSATLTLESYWKPEHLHVVALVWTDADGVLGVNRSPAITLPENINP